MLNYSAANASTTTIHDAQGFALTKIMRIHIYDKQVTPYKAAQGLLRNETNDGFIMINKAADDYAKSFTPDPTQTLQAIAAAAQAKIQLDKTNGFITITNFSVGSNQFIKDIVSKTVPTIRFGANGTTIISANLSSKTNSLVTTHNMLNSKNANSKSSPNGSGDLGIPLRVIPAQLNMTTKGCPLSTMAQNYFIDFQTGTTLDNLYILTHFVHSFSPGKFETQWTFGYSDGYGVFEGAPNIVNLLAGLPTDTSTTTTTTTSPSPGLQPSKTPNS
jgi:hypothetical protein